MLIFRFILDYEMFTPFHFQFFFLILPIDAAPLSTFCLNAQL